MNNLGDIRKITLLDLDKIIDLERKCFANEIAYSPKQLKYLITKANSTCLAEINEKNIRGFIIVLYKNGSEVAGVETLNVDPLFRGRGIGKKLLIAAEDEMTYRGVQKIRLEVSVHNIPAINLYEKSGFRKISLIKNYYYYNQNGSRDAFRMIKELTT